MPSDVAKHSDCHPVLSIPDAAPGSFFHLILVVAVVTTALSFGSGSGRAFAEAAKMDENIPTVTVSPATEAEVINRISISGTLVPRREVLILPKVSGYTIEAISVEVGDVVEAGAVLATLNDRTLRSELALADAEVARVRASVRQAQSLIASAQAAQTQTEAALERSRRLKNSGALSDASLDQSIASAQAAQADLTSANDGLTLAEAQLQFAEAKRDLARLNLDDTEITTPVAGLILSRTAKVGAIATSGGDPLFRIVEGGVIELEAEVIETALGRVELGDTVETNIAGIVPISGSIRLISPAVNPVTRLGQVRIEFDEPPALRMGLFASGWITTDKHLALTVPATAVLADQTGTFVQVVVDGVVEKRPVTAGLIWNDRREIITGLTESEIVVSKAGAFFGDGDKIIPMQHTPSGD